jgi:hypothetical protein
MRPVDLPVTGLAILSFLAVGLIPTARASELAQATLRGSTANAMAIDAAPSYPVYAPTPPADTTYPPEGAPPSPPLARPQPPAQFSGYRFEFGTRVFLSSGRLAKDLFDDPRSSQSMLSRLTYSGLTSAAFEGFGRADLVFGSFIKGYVGFSNLSHGALNDEDFPPGITPYSNTSSQQQNGKLAYGAIDIGEIVAHNDHFRASFFAGFGFINEKVNAFGCSQLASNPAVCVPTIDPSVLGITEDSRWQFARLGVLAEFRVLDRLAFSAEVAWLPYVQMGGNDTHWLRLGSGLGDISGPIPEAGGGSGVQIEALMSYAVSDCFTVGLGGRYWYLQTHGSTDFENVIVGFPSPVAQPLNFTTYRYGGFAQGAYKFAPL